MDKGAELRQARQLEKEADRRVLAHAENCNICDIHDSGEPMISRRCIDGAVLDAIHSVMIRHAITLERAYWVAVRAAGKEVN